MATNFNLKDALRELIGHQVSSVEFVQDYVQMHFDGPSLIAYTWPVVKGDAGSKFESDEGYRDGLCSIIGAKVLDVGADDEEVALYFCNGTAITVSLRDEDYSGPEAIQFRGTSGNWWVI